MSHDSGGAQRDGRVEGALAAGTPFASLDAWRDTVIIRALWAFWLATSLVVGVVVAREGLGRWFVLAPMGTAWAVLLYGIAPSDPATLATSAALLLLGASASMIAPARRAGAIAPADALKE